MSKLTKLVFCLLILSQPGLGQAMPHPKDLLAGANGKLKSDKKENKSFTFDKSTFTGRWETKGCDDLLGTPIVVDIDHAKDDHVLIKFTLNEFGLEDQEDFELSKWVTKSADRESRVEFLDWDISGKLVLGLTSIEPGYHSSERIEFSLENKQLVMRSMQVSAGEFGEAPLMNDSYSCKLQKMRD